MGDQQGVPSLDLWWQKTEIIGKVLVGVAGLVLSAVLAWGEWQDKEQDAARKSEEIARARDETARAREADATGEFHRWYERARDAKPGDENALNDLDVAGARAQILAREFNKPYYVDVVGTLRARLTPPRVGDLVQVASSLKLQSDEATARSKVALSPDEWFAVIATYSGNQEGLRFASERRTGAQAKLGCVEVWKTKIGGQYAVVAGGKVPRIIALANAQRARQTGEAADAFTQANREWTLQVSCKFLQPINGPVGVGVAGRV